MILLVTALTKETYFSGSSIFTKVHGLAKSESPQTLQDFQTLLVLEPLQKLLLPLTFGSNVPLLKQRKVCEKKIVDSKFVKHVMSSYIISFR